MASISLGSAAVFTAKTATATGAASSGPILLIAIGAIVGIGAVIAWAKSESKTTEATEEKTITDLTDQYVLEQIEKENCGGVIDLEALQKLIKEVFSRHPEKEVFMGEKIEKCIKTAKEETSDEKKVPTLEILGKIGGTGMIGKIIYDEFSQSPQRIRNLDAEKKQKLAEDDKLVLENLKDELVEGVESEEQFVRLVQETFKRNPAHAVFLGKNYLRCLEKIRKNKIL